MNNFKSLHEQVAEKLIKALQDGTSPFQLPWSKDNAGGFTMPMNPTTGIAYRGTNALWLAMQGRDDPRWLTLNQASRQKWSIEKGAKGTMINFVKTSDIRHMKDGEGNFILDDNGKKKTEVVKLDKPVIQKSFVFNAEQIKGIPALIQEEVKWNPVDRAEAIITASEAVIKHGGNEAYYLPAKDIIQLPKKAQFDEAAQYYATLLHELGHWSGHETRLNRGLSTDFASDDYAREELRAEIASLMIGDELKIGHEFGKHAAYVDSWIKILQNDPLELHKAASDAQKIFDYVLKIEQKLEIKEAPAAKVNPKYLAVGDLIDYRGTQYLVKEDMKKGKVKLEDLKDGSLLPTAPVDGLYKALLKIRNAPNGEQQIAGAEISRVAEESVAYTGGRKR